MRLDPKKLEVVREFPTPKTPKNIKQFLGLAEYYRRFISEFSKLAKRLTQLLKNDTIFQWRPIQSFELLKDKLCQELVLQYPNFSKPFILTTDASGYAISEILSQVIINKDRPIAYASRTLNDNKIKYDTYEKEALAIIYRVSKCTARGSRFKNSGCLLPRKFPGKRKRRTLVSPKRNEFILTNYNKTSLRT